MIQILHSHLEEWPSLTLRRGIGTIHISFNCPDYGNKLAKLAAIGVRGESVVLAVHEVIGTDPSTGRLVAGKMGALGGLAMTDKVQHPLTDPESLEQVFSRLHQHLVSYGYAHDRPEL